MNQQNTVESRVLSILKDCPRARFDDMILIMHYYNRYATYLRAGELPLNDLAFVTLWRMLKKKEPARIQKYHHVGVTCPAKLVDAKAELTRWILKSGHLRFK